MPLVSVASLCVLLVEAELPSVTRVRCPEVPGGGWQRAECLNASVALCGPRNAESDGWRPADGVVPHFRAVLFWVSFPRCHFMLSSTASAEAAQASVTTACGLIIYPWNASQNAFRRTANRLDRGNA